MKNYKIIKHYKIEALRDLVIDYYQNLSMRIINQLTRTELLQMLRYQYHEQYDLKKKISEHLKEKYK